MPVKMKTKLRITSIRQLKSMKVRPVVDLLKLMLKGLSIVIIITGQFQEDQFNNAI